jgi:hypothetical protein
MVSVAGHRCLGTRRPSVRRVAGMAGMAVEGRWIWRTSPGMLIDRMRGRRMRPLWRSAVHGRQSRPAYTGRESEGVSREFWEGGTGVRRIPFCFYF